MRQSHIKNNQLPSFPVALDKSASVLEKRDRAKAAVRDLWLTMEESRHFEGCAVELALEQAATLMSFLEGDLPGNSRLENAWRQFIFPVMLDDASAAYNRVSEAMKILLST